MSTVRDPGNTPAAPSPLPAPSSGAAMGAVWGYLMRTWRATAVGSVLSAIGVPVLTLLAMGLGLGTLVDRGNRAALPGGVGYLQFLAPALVMAAAVQTAVTEAAYPTFAKFKWRRVFFGISATPVTPRQIAAGEVLFVATRVAVGAILLYPILLLFGAGGGWRGLWMVPVAVLTACACAVWVLALVAVMHSEGGALNLLFRFGVVPMTLFSGSFFPVDTMPAGMRWIAWISPLWHGNEVARSAVLGTAAPLPVLGHLAVLVVMLLLGAVVAVRKFQRRLVS
ncbi:ABC transporter permease [Nakamurella sp. YIM 132087]|uniref:Transport permease protein n=1 Tax=Nakamurella alba TaxID=2665158 RepID=A0A7K1FGE8_9ACTN|nr:ABC transporter permease [Nakamurella alba]MTD13130.1 ABC transporter permease [Nakamurella alba]